MGYMKTEFEKWLSSLVKKDGSHYSKETQSNYITALKSYPGKMTGLNLDISDLFHIDDLDNYDRIYQIITGDSKFESFNNGYHRIFSSALIMYRNFLEARVMNSITKPSRLSFVDWMNAGTWKKTTVSKYTKALEKCGEWLGIELEKPVMDIMDMDEFLAVEARIKSTEDYDQINARHGKGDLNAALRLYQKYLESLDKPNSSSGFAEDGPGNSGENTAALATSECISHIKSYISAKGFAYPDGTIENFYLSLKSKPFVILAGTSGTGKTRLVKLFAEAIDAEYKLVPVRPDWSDSSDLFGHVDLNGTFVPGAILDFVKQASADLERPYFLCLDEMNLARVEYYMSDLLSIIETRDFEDGERIVTAPLLTVNSYGGDASAIRKYGNICLPENLYIVGTVNMDETTFPFSRKVLDRANTIEFSYVDLMPSSSDSEDIEPLNLPNRFLKTEFLLLNQCSAEAETVGSWCAELQKINKILQTANAHVGYRVRDEVVFYMLNNKTADLIAENAAMDNEIMQKILPRIQGSSNAVKKMLCELFKVCAGDYKGYQTDAEDLSVEMFKIADAPGCTYPKSAKKIAFMVRRYEEDGFTSYWL